MAGHSQFKNIMVRKGAQDKKRGKIFTKIIREIMVAAKSGAPEIQKNPKLRAAVMKARAENMPKDKIEAAIAKGAGLGENEHYEAVRYEGYGAAGVAVIVEALTDNRNRTAAEMRSAFLKYGGSLGETGSVGFMFEHVGLMEYPAAQILEEAMLDAAIEAGAENVETADGRHTITTALSSFAAVRDALAQRFGDPLSAKLIWRAKISASAAGEEARKILALIEALEDHDDVQEVFTNIEISADELQKLSA